MEKGASEASAPCARCGKPAQLQCPKCAELKLPRENAAFCTQDCFRAAWSSHKSVHPKPGALASQQSPEGWKYCLRKGRGRALQLPRFEWTGPLRPYPISKMRVVPDEIEKPDWALDIAREVLDAAARVIKPGITTDEIDRVVHEETIARGGYPSPLNYHFFPKSCCTSVNEVICHGIPDARKLEDGDIVNVDVTVYYKGVHGDLNETYFVGNVDEASKQLVRCTYECLEKAIAIVKPGVRFREVGEIINRHASMSGLSVVKSYCGHGIGELFHCAPNIPHYSRVWNDRLWPDDWTAVTTDGKRSAQFEHTLLVTDTGCEVLTARLPSSPDVFPWLKP
ncbi:Methionine aminopeptidase [Zea mays]|uniref:Methionine aminopeptidase n=1 Tax=Zea mays TaxID=4577 RepID=A0A1D6GNE2_MAIZE|nr:Methionine aminopeptidase [Zea mays]